MQLSKNFTDKELCITDTKITNIPNEEELQKLMYLANYVLQPIRNRFGSVLVHSGFRSEEVNAAIGGVKTSQHRKGEAVDFSVPGVPLEQVYLWAKDNLSYGQIIYEEKGGKRWIHISLPRINGMNLQALKFDGTSYSPWT